MFAATSSIGYQSPLPARGSSVVTSDRASQSGVMQSGIIEHQPEVAGVAAEGVGISVIEQAISYWL
jgi:hypothetical protein